MDASAPSPGARAAGDATRDVPAQDLPTDPSVSRGGPVEGDAPSTPPSVDSTRASLSEPTTTEEPDATPRQTFHAAHASSRAPAGDLGRPLQHLHLRLTSGTEDDISLKLALADGALDVTIVTADAALSRYLSDERPTLLANLTASGYAVDAVSVEHRPTDQAQLAAPFASQSGMQRERSHARRNVEHADHESAASSAVDSLGDSAPARASSTERVV